MFNILNKVTRTIKEISIMANCEFGSGAERAPFIVSDEMSGEWGWVSLLLLLFFFFIIIIVGEYSHYMS